MHRHTGFFSTYSYSYCFKKYYFEFVFRNITLNLHTVLNFFQVVSLTLGTQTGYTKHPCFLCLWDSRADSMHYEKKVWPPREAFRIGSNNVIAEPLVPPQKILLPPLHIKLGIMKNYVKTLNKVGQAFKFLLQKFPQISDAKLHGEIFDGLQIRNLISNLMHQWRT